jgi:hypothetical protein
VEQKHPLILFLFLRFVLTYRQGKEEEEKGLSFSLCKAGTDRTFSSLGPHLGAGAWLLERERKRRFFYGLVWLDMVCWVE